jgi:hypothetical protein
MNKLMSFVRLDFVTMKSYFSVMNLVIYATLTLFLTITFGNAAMGICGGVMIATLSVSQPFAIGEKSSLDAFYPTLSLKRKTVVAGRYLFTLTLNICAVLFTIILAFLGLFVAGMTGMIEPGGDTVWILLVISATLIVVQAIQLPLFFKVGYTKARFLSIVPFWVVMALSFAFATFAKNADSFGGMPEVLINLLNNSILLALFSIAILSLVVFASYRLSLSFYRKREF